MTVAELQPVGGSDFGRTPPQDVYAEQCVVGGMLLSKDAIADVVEVLRSGDFYRPAHQVLFDVIIDLYGRGEPADAVTVAAELTKRGEIARVGGADYLHTVMALVPVAANAGYYARIVHERAILRRLVEAGSRITQMGYAADAEVDDIVDRAQAEVYAVTERRTGDDYLRLSEVLPATLDEIEAIGSRGGAIFGVPTGFSELDQLTNGLHPGQMVILAARPAIGKALSLDTPLPTPDGWTTMREVQVGAQLLDADGHPTTVLAATDVMYDRPCYRVEFSDGTSIVADAEHGWRTQTRPSRRSIRPAEPAAGSDRVGNPRGAIHTTKEIAATVRCPTTDRRVNHAVLNAEPLSLPERDLPVAPYTLGVWLCDGSSAAGDLSESAGVMTPRASDKSSLGTALGSMDVHGDRHIPIAYLRAAEWQRHALLAGLLDAGGIVTGTGSVRFACTSGRLAAGVHDLIVGLGYRCRMTTRRVRGRSQESSTRWILTFTPLADVFRLDRKRKAHKDRARTPYHRVTSRSITSVTPIRSVPVRCVQVGNPDQMYLAGRSMVPTHNSTLALDLVRSASVKHGLASVIFSLEMSRSEITMRLLSAEAKVALHSIRSGTLSDDDWTRLARRMSEVSEAPLFIDDSPNLTMMEIRAKARRLRQQHDLRVVVVDYMQLMQSPRRVESRQQEVSEISRSMKLLAKELDVPVLAISQLNRGPEQRNDKKPQLADLRESGCLTAGTRLLRADTGAEVSLGELQTSGERDVPVWSLDDRLKLVPRTLTHAFPSGTRQVFRLRLSSGREVEATGNHKFLTLDGWRPVDELAPGSRVGVPRYVPTPLEVGGRPETTLRSDKTFVPAEVFRLPTKQVGLFVRHLWATEGSVRWDAKARQARISYASTSRRLADDLARLLLRCGVLSRIRRVREAGCRDRFQVVVHGAENQLRFLEEIGVHGERGVLAEFARLGLRGVVGNPNVDTIPVEVWERVRQTLRERRMPHREFGAATRTRCCGPMVGEHAPRRARLAQMADVLKDADLDVLATNDVFWDTVVAAESLGEQPVYDATVIGTHNFIANGIAAHNSLEQDADMVILLNREDAYERESPRAGEADLIVAKHRNGPTKTVTVAFQGHYSRFVDMAPG